MEKKWSELACFLLAKCGGIVNNKNSFTKKEVTKPFLDKLKEKKIDSLYYLLYDSENIQQTFYDLVWRYQSQILEQVLSRLAEEKVKVLIFKGAEFFRRYFKDRPIGLLNDIDLLIPRDQILRAQKVLYSMGFLHGFVDTQTFDYKLRDVSEVATIMLSHYELPPLNKPIIIEFNLEYQGLALESCHPVWFNKKHSFILPEFDLHFQVASDIVDDTLFERSIPSSFLGASTLNSADALWFTLSRYYNEVALYDKQSLRDFAYIIPILEHETIDWGLFMSSVNLYKLHSTLFYFLTFCNKLSKKTVPTEILQELSPHKNIRMRDWGWQIEKLFDEVPEFPYTEMIKDLGL